MRNIAVLIVAVLMLGVWSVNAEETQRRALAEELLNVMNIPDAIEQSFAMVKEMIPGQIENMKVAMGDTEEMPANVISHTQKMIDMITKEFSWDKMKDDYITLYAETFTEQVLKDTITFYKSPAGQVFVKKQPELMKQSMEISQKLMMQIMPKILAMTNELAETLVEQE